MLETKNEKLKIAKARYHEIAIQNKKKHIDEKEYQKKFTTMVTNIKKNVEIDKLRLIESSEKAGRIVF